MDCIIKPISHTCQSVAAKMIYCSIIQCQRRVESVAGKSHIMKSMTNQNKAPIRESESTVCSRLGPIYLGGVYLGCARLAHQCRTAQSRVDLGGGCMGHGNCMRPRWGSRIGWAYGRRKHTPVSASAVILLVQLSQDFEAYALWLLTGESSFADLCNNLAYRTYHCLQDNTMVCCGKSRK